MVKERTNKERRRKAAWFCFDVSCRKQASVSVCGLERFYRQHLTRSCYGVMMDEGCRSDKHLRDGQVKLFTCFNFRYVCCPPPSQQRPWSWYGRSSGGYRPLNRVCISLCALLYFYVFPLHPSCLYSVSAVFQVFIFILLYMVLVFSPFACVSTSSAACFMSLCPCLFSSSTFLTRSNLSLHVSLLVNSREETW